MNQQIQNEIQILRAQKNTKNLPTQWRRTSFSFYASDFPEAVDISSVIDALIRQYRRAMELENKSAIAEFERDLAHRGLAPEELKDLKRIALEKEDHTYGLHVRVGQLFRASLKQQGVELEKIQNSAPS